MQTEEVRAATARFEACNGAQALIDAFLDIIQAHGLRAFVAADFSVEERSRLLLYSSIPAFFAPLDSDSPWWSDDPVVAWLGQGEMRPFRVEDAWAEALPSAAPRWQHIVEQGLGRGWVMPTSKPGYIGGVHMICGDDEARLAQLPEKLPVLHLIAIYFHAYMTELDPEAGRGGVIRNTLRNRATGERRAKLTPREIDCLRWCAFGKTAEEIAMIEALSVHTVRGYLKTAMSKLDSVSQAQAVARGLKFGLFRI